MGANKEQRLGDYDPRPGRRPSFAAANTHNQHKWHKAQFARYKNPFCSPASLSSSPVSSPQVARSSQRAARGRTRRGSGSAQTLVVEVEVEVVLMVEMVDGGGG